MLIIQVFKTRNTHFVPSTGFYDPGFSTLYTLKSLEEGYKRSADKITTDSVIKVMATVVPEVE